MFFVIFHINILWCWFLHADFDWNQSQMFLFALLQNYSPIWKQKYFFDAKPFFFLSLCEYSHRAFFLEILLEFFSTYITVFIDYIFCFLDFRFSRIKDDGDGRSGSHSISRFSEFYAKTTYLCSQNLSIHSDVCYSLQGMFFFLFFFDFFSLFSSEFQ